MWFLLSYPRLHCPNFPYVSRYHFFVVISCLSCVYLICFVWFVCLLCPVCHLILSVFAVLCVLSVLSIHVSIYLHIYLSILFVVGSLFSMHDMIRGMNGMNATFPNDLYPHLAIQCQTRSRFWRTSWCLSISPSISSIFARFHIIQVGSLQFFSHGIWKSNEPWHLQKGWGGFGMVLGNYYIRFLSCFYIRFLQVLHVSHYFWRRQKQTTLPRIWLLLLCYYGLVFLGDRVGFGKCTAFELVSCISLPMFL